MAGTAVLASTSTLGATPTTTAPSGASALTSTSTLGSAASTTELGASALTSTSSMSSAATTVGTTGGALTSTSTLGAAGTSQVAGTSALVSTSTLGAAAASATTGGVAALTSTSALGATALVKEVGAAALASTSALGSAASITEVDAAALSSASSLSPVATATTTAGAALASTSALGSAASATVPAAAVLASTSTLVSAGTETTTGVPALSSTSALAAAGAATVSGAMALSSTSALAVRTGVAGATTLTSTSALGAVGTVTTTGATALASTSALTAIGQEVFGAAALISQSTLGAATFFTITGGVTLRSTSMLAASADVTYVPPVFITGSDAALTSTSALGVTTSQAGTVALASTSSLGAALGPVTPVYAPNIPLASTSSLGVFSNPPGGAVVLQSFSFLNTPSTTPSTVQAGIALLSTSTMLPVDVFVLDRSGDMITLNLTNTGTIPQPGTLLVNVGNGRAYDTVSFSIDGVATGVTTQLDGAGTVTQMAIGVDGYSAGGHVITVTGVNGTSPQVSFVLDSSSPVLTPLPVGVLPPPVAVTAVQRWTFQAYNFSSVLAVPTYTFAINPTSLQQVFGEPRITSLPSTVINGMTFSWEGSPQALTWTAEGRTLTQADHDALVFWSQRNDRVWLTDEFLRRFLIKVDTLKMTRIRDVDRPWHHIYTMTFTVLAGAGVLI